MAASTFTRGTFDLICERIAGGMSLRQACAGDDMPSHGTFIRWVNEDPATLADHYARAMVRRTDYWAEEIVDIADDGTNDFVERVRRDGSKETAFSREHVERSRQRIEARKWLMGKLAPKKYGDRVTQEHTGNLGYVVYGEKESESMEAWKRMHGQPPA